VVTAAQDVAYMRMAGNIDELTAAKARLKQLQEEYKWTAERKR
jgi:hypothetical protein